jgi:arylsulfatase A-like enzyme
LPDSILTLAEGLKEAGYRTGMAGKWHLGYRKNKFLPPGQGFDSWLGLPYSHDYQPPWYPTKEPLRMYRNNTLIEESVNLDSLTIRYTQEALRFIKKNNSTSPFFFYLAYNMPHLPLRTTDAFRGRSGAGLYADVVESIDWSVGQILQVLDNQGLSENTLIFFTSDNGPWKKLPSRMLNGGIKPWHQGSAGLLRGSKRTTYEGGTRVPAIIRWPKHIPQGQVLSQLAATPDIYRTLLEIGDAMLPDYPLDGYNLLPWLTGSKSNSPRKQYAYFLYGRLEAMVIGDWKLRLASNNTQLFNLREDPSERINRARELPEIVKRIKQRMKQTAREVGVPLAKK